MKPLTINLMCQRLPDYTPMPTARDTQRWKFTTANSPAWLGELTYMGYSKFVTLDWAKKDLQERVNLFYDEEREVSFVVWTSDES